MGGDVSRQPPEEYGARYCTFMRHIFRAGEVNSHSVGAAFETSWVCRRLGHDILRSTTHDGIEITEWNRSTKDADSLDEQADARRWLPEVVDCPSEKLDASLDTVHHLGVKENVPLR